MNGFQILFLALLLDFIFGDPLQIWSRIPHPAVIMGRFVDWFDDHFNRGKLRREKGILAIALLAILALAVGYLLKILPDYGIVEMLVVTALLAHNNLVKHVRAVATGLAESLKAGQTEVAKIVGRETKNLDEAGVATAAIESAAENFSDAVVAPIFWYLILGLPGIILYKVVNTADSMIGHKSETYAEFGFGSAKLDDLLNLIPARICGALMCFVQTSKNTWDVWDLMLSDAPLHASPNAGWPESAMAGILDIRLSGPRIYDGELTDDAYINPQGNKNPNRDDILESTKVIQRTWYAIAATIGFFALVTWIF
ncbi:cobalamin biosynthesis protein CobD [Amylibacter kogurei]|uniref:Cobalamin biosynthesis protein CobD n=1 Tax=Paramylibacter kogurei TaxID=1889778 RepID=A0A2G5K0W9_9RHOB|nr:adenosylcobinamide-phosphate synthase CbiB [Amylibacter kogurei]PIB23188.1 cobalamin biosynthesis protein CobD [Amylibacter kogurei]